MWNNILQLIKIFTKNGYQYDGESMARSKFELEEYNLLQNNKLITSHVSKKVEKTDGKYIYFRWR